MKSFRKRAFSIAVCLILLLGYARKTLIPDGCFDKEDGGDQIA